MPFFSCFALCEMGRRVRLQTAIGYALSAAIAVVRPSHRRWQDNADADVRGAIENQRKADRRVQKGRQNVDVRGHVTITNSNRGELPQIEHRGPGIAVREPTLSFSQSSGLTRWIFRDPRHAC
jgi:hypothetical protein